MVDPVDRISRTDAATPTDIGRTLAIGSDAHNAWIAARQAQINADLDDLHKAATEELARRKAEDEGSTPDEPPAHARQWGAPFGEWEEAEEPPPALSGESDRIGTQNFDEDTPFGDRTAIL